MDFDPWSPKDYAMLGTALSATQWDIQATKDLLKRGGGEANPIYGTPHPSGSSLDTEGLITAALATAAAHAMPEEYRSAFLGGWTGFEAGLGYAGEKTPGAQTVGPRESPKEGPDPMGIAIPSALVGALAGYALPSGLAEKIRPEIHPHYRGISYTQKFAKGGPVMPPLPKNVRRVTFGRTRKVGTKRKDAIRIAR